MCCTEQTCFRPRVAHVDTGSVRLFAGVSKQSFQGVASRNSLCCVVYFPVLYSRGGRIRTGCMLGEEATILLQMFSFNINGAIRRAVSLFLHVSTGGAEVARNVSPPSFGFMPHFLIEGMNIEERINNVFRSLIGVSVTGAVLLPHHLWAFF